MIEDKYYRVLGSPNSVFPEAFQYRKKGFSGPCGEAVRGWRFKAEEITHEETLKLLKERKMACLVLNPECVEEITEKMVEDKWLRKP